MSANTPENPPETPGQEKHSDRLGDLLKNKDRQPLAGNYSQIVRTLRIFLPLAALGVMAIIILTSRGQDEFRQAREDFQLEKPATNELTKPRFESRDKKNQPYTITANKAIQSETQRHKIFLDKPMADMMTSGGTWVAVEADQGEYTEDNEKLILKGNVHLFQDDGYSLRTEEMLLNLNNRTAHSDNPVEAHGPAGQLKAKGLTANQNDNKIIFQGPAKLTLHNTDDKQILPE